MRRYKTALILTLLMTVFLLVSCGGQKDESVPEIGKAQRDSVLSESPLPGSSGIKGAMAVSDSAKARAERANAAANP